MNHASLFSGIGGFDYAAELMNWNNIFNCKIDKFCQTVLKYHFPKAINYENITTTNFSIHNGTIDVLTGGFPCQPFSVAGLRKGTDDSRYLWNEMLRAICEIQPSWVVGENVLGIVNWSDGLVFEQICSDLEAQGYEVQTYVLPACSQNAPHKRDRVWFVAYSESNRYRRWENQQRSGSKWNLLQRECSGSSLGNKIERCCGEWSASNSNEIRNGQEHKLCSRGYMFKECFNQPRSFTNNSQRIDRQYNFKSIERQESKFRESSCRDNVAYANSERYEKYEFATKSNKQSGLDSKKNISSGFNSWQNFPVESAVCSGDDGLSYGLDSITFSKWRAESIKAAGNAIVPQVALQIFKSIEMYEMNELEELKTNQHK